MEDDDCVYIGEKRAPPIIDLTNDFDDFHSKKTKN